MISAFRAFSNSWAAKILLGVLGLSFVFFGVQGSFNGMRASDAVVSAGDRKVTSADFRREFDNFKRMAEQQSGQQVTAEIAAKNGLDKQLLQQLAGQEAMVALVQKLGIKPSDTLVAGELRRVTAFFSPVTGQFDKDLYAQKLQENGLTPSRFDDLLAGQIAQNHLASALQAGLVAPRAYGALAALFGMESRDIGYFVVPASSVRPVAPPTDAQLTQFMKENAAQFTRPEYRVLSLARFSPTLITGELKIDEAELQKRYAFRKDTLTKPETRSLVQIPAKDAAAAAQIVTRLGKGETPEAIAKSLGVEAINYADKPKSAVPDPAVAEAAFKLPVGQVSAPIKGELGYAVIRVNKITPGVTPSLEQIRQELEAELRKDAAAEKVYEMTQAYDDAHAAGSNLTEAATKAGAALMTLPPLSREGSTPDGQNLQGLPPNILQTAFNLPAGGESEVEELGGGEYYAVRVEKVVPSGMAQLSEIRPQLTQYWMARETLQRLQTRADALAARVRKGETLEAVAGSIGGQVARAVGMSRMTAAQQTSVPKEVAEQAFAAKPGEVFVAQAGGAGLLVGKVEAVRAEATPDMGQMVEAARPQLSQTVTTELLRSAEQGARTTMKVKTNYALARQAIGLEAPEDAKKDKKK